MSRLVLSRLASYRILFYLIVFYLIVFYCIFFIVFIVLCMSKMRTVCDITTYWTTERICALKPTRCTSISNLFYFGVTRYMFRTVFPSIISSSRLYVQQPNRSCCLLASKQTAGSVWQMPVAVCTVLNCWWWTERPSETCRVLLQIK